MIQYINKGVEIMDTTYERGKIDQLEAKLTTKEQLLIETRVQNETNEPLIAWLIWFFLGLFGAHRFYMQKPNAALMLILEIIGILTMIFIIGFIFLFIIFIWWIIDAFNLIQWIEEDRIHPKRVILETFIESKNNQ